MAYHPDNGVKSRLHHNWLNRQMQRNYWAPHVTVAAIIEKNGQFLLVEENVNGKKVLNQPAGHLEDHETLLDAVIRETREETRREFTPEYISGIYRWVHDNGETYLRICYAGTVSDEDRTLSLDTGIEGTIWLSETELRQQANLRSPLVLKCIEDFTRGQHFPLNLIQDVQ